MSRPRAKCVRRRRRHGNNVGDRKKVAVFLESGKGPRAGVFFDYESKVSPRYITRVDGGNLFLGQRRLGTWLDKGRDSKEGGGEVTCHLKEEKGQEIKESNKMGHFSVL